MKVNLGILKRNEISNYLHQFKELGSDYITIGIIGAQSSGKSTLLNHLFQTSFGVMDAQQKRKQTTKGIWMQVESQYKSVILDIEGADSRERWQDKNKFEQSTALFGLVISNVLIVNIWIQEVGRFSACNYEILKLIFELNLRFFQKDTATKIMFVIRDFRDVENYEAIKTDLIRDVERLWSEIKKPKDKEELKYNDVFEVLVFTMNHFIYEKQQFLEDVKTLRQILTDRSSDEYIFRDQKLNNIPFDGMFVYLKQIWETIESNKDINIPNQKIMVSTFRCNELKEQSLNNSIKDFNSLRNDLKNNKAIDIKKAYDNIIEEQVEFFKSSAEYYDDKIVSDYIQELREKMEIEFEDVFEMENKKITKKLLEDVNTDMKKLMYNNKQNVNKVLDNITKKKQAAQQKYKDYIYKFNLSEQKKNQCDEVFNLALQNMITTFLANSTSNFIEKIKNEKQQLISDKVYTTFKNLNEETWQQFNEFSNQQLEDVNLQFEDLKQKYPDVKDLFTDDIIDSTRSGMISYIKENLQTKKNRIVDIIIDQFYQDFNYDGNGQQRNWKDYEESDINQLYNLAFQKYAPTMNCLKNSLILDIDGDIILNNEETDKLRNQLKVKSNDILTDAYLKKQGLNTFQRVPKWFWGLFAFFAYDNVLNWFSHPIFTALFVLILIGLGGLIFTGNLYVLKNFYSFAQSYILAIVMKTEKPDFGDLLKAQNVHKEKQKQREEKEQKKLQ